MPLLPPVISAVLFASLIFISLRLLSGASRYLASIARSSIAPAPLTTVRTITYRPEK
jgi:hypothetical protein